MKEINELYDITLKIKNIFVDINKKAAEKNKAA